MVREKTNPFDFVKSINSREKQNLIEEADNPELIEKEYNPFVVNRAFSYYVDTIHFVNVLNKYHRIDKKLQYEFLLNVVRPMKRFEKWGEKSDHEDLEVVKTYYKFGTAKALTALSILTCEQLAAIRAALDPGGMR